MGIARRQYTEEFKRGAVGLLASSGRDDSIHEPEGKLLGQCTDGKLLRHYEN